jgi:hypothetical protein
MSADPLRRITTVQAFDNPGHEKSRFVGGSTRFELECGHVVFRKQSRGIPKRGFARCKECWRLSQGAFQRTFDKGKGIVTIESWDPKTKMPKRSVMRMTQKEWDES